MYREDNEDFKNIQDVWRDRIDNISGLFTFAKNMMQQYKGGSVSFIVNDENSSSTFIVQF